MLAFLVKECALREKRTTMFVHLMYGFNQCTNSTRKTRENKELQSSITLQILIILKDSLRVCNCKHIDL
jgi:hypothetical protein